MNLFYLVPAAAVAALLFAWFFFRQMMKESEGTVTMKEIALYVRKGAMAYLKQQYKVVAVVFVILAAVFAVLAVFGIQNPWVPFAFLTGGFFSGLAGFVGMKTVTQFRVEAGVPFGCRDGSYRSRPGTARHFFMVYYP